MPLDREHRHAHIVLSIDSEKPHRDRKRWQPAHPAFRVVLCEVRTEESLIDASKEMWVPCVVVEKRTFDSVGEESWIQVGVYHHDMPDQTEKEVRGIEVLINLASQVRDLEMRLGLTEAVARGEGEA